MRCVLGGVLPYLRQVAGFGDPRVAAVGLDLDTKLAALLRVLTWPVPAELQNG